MKYIFIFLIKIYQRVISPLFPSSCRFYPTCSQYSLESFQKHGAFKGFWLSVVRIVKCGPYHPGGIDKVPDEFHCCSKSK